MDLISRKEAKGKGLTHYFTGKPCKHGHIDKRFVSAGKCLTCSTIEGERQKEWKKEHYQKNKEAICKRVNDYRLANIDVITEKKRLYNQINNDEISKRRKEFRENNKELLSEQKRNHYQRHKSSIRKKHKKFYSENKREILDSQKEYYKANSERIKNTVRQYAVKNKSKIKKYKHTYNKENRVELNLKINKKYRTDPLFRLAVIIRQSVRRVLKYTGKCKTTPTMILLGYNAEQLKNRIESTWVEGMSWENHGEWHIDHIKSVKSYVDEGVKDPKIINALENLQALWASDNLSKGCR